MLSKPSDQQNSPQPGLNRKPVSSETFVPEPLLDTDEAAAIMRVHPKTLQRYARRGVVRGFQLGTMWRFRASDIDRWISERLASWLFSRPLPGVAVGFKQAIRCAGDKEFSWQGAHGISKEACNVASGGTDRMFGYFAGERLDQTERAFNARPLSEP
jgi:excisionase family DNA binding protein